MFHCHAGCPQDRVLETLRRRGLWVSRAAPRPRRSRWPGPRPAPEVEAVLAREERQAARRRAYAWAGTLADELKDREQAARALREQAAALGDIDDAWALLAAAAALDDEARELEGLWETALAAGAAVKEVR